MSLLPWSSRYLIGVDVIDQQHFQLIKLANDLASALKDNTGHEVIFKLLSELADYTEFHLDYEERLMRQHHYPGLPEQERQHGHLRAAVSELARKARARDVTVPVQTMHFLRTWLREHILNTDMEMAAYLIPRMQGRAARPAAEKLAR